MMKWKILSANVFDNDAMAWCVRSLEMALSTGSKWREDVQSSFTSIPHFMCKKNLDQQLEWYNGLENQLAYWFHILTFWTYTHTSKEEDTFTQTNIEMDNE